MTQPTEKQTYQVLVPFMFANQKQSRGTVIELTARQAANLIAGGFIGAPKTTE